MSDAKAAWNKVGADMTALGLKLKLHLEQVGARPDVEGDVKDAVRQLGEAMQRGFAGIGNVARDAAVREDVAKVAQSLGDALAVSFSEVGQGVAEAVRGSDQKN